MRVCTPKTMRVNQLSKYDRHTCNSYIHKICNVDFSGNDRYSLFLRSHHAYAFYVDFCTDFFYGLVSLAYKS